MPWEFEKVEDKRRELIEAYLRGIPMTYLCKLHRVSRKTAYKWVKRYLELGPEQGLQDLSRAPHEPTRRYGEEADSHGHRPEASKTNMGAQEDPSFAEKGVSR